MKDTIFKSNEPMLPKENRDISVQVAQTAREFHYQNLVPAFDRKYPEASVENVERPRRGYGY